MQGLFAAIGFLTRVPVPASAFSDQSAQAHSLAWYPMVGLLIGAILCGLQSALGDTPRLVSAALILLVWVGVTGGLHVDGLADSADAWVGGLGDRVRTMEIMKDPRSGPAGVVTIVLLLLLKFAALASLPRSAWMAVLLAPMLARSGLTLAFITTPYVRSGGLGRNLVDASRGACIGAVGLSSALIIFAGARFGVWAWVAGALVFCWWRLACMRRLGGMTGDTCGALAELLEAAVLVAAALAA